MDTALNLPWQRLDMAGEDIYLAPPLLNHPFTSTNVTLL